MTAAPPPQLRDSDEDPADTPQIRALRIAVIVMALLLVVGFLTVIARIVYLASRSSAQPDSARAASNAPVPAAGVLMPEAVVELPAGAAVKGVSLAGDRLAVQYNSPAGDGVAILDLVTGRVVSRVRVAPSAAAR